MKNIYDARHIKTINTYIYIGLLSFLIVSIPLSEFGMSLSQFLLLAFWLWEGSENYEDENWSFSSFIIRIKKNFIRKINLYSHQKGVIIFSSIFLLHIIGLLYTSDYQVALFHLRIKLPIITLPLFLSVSPKLHLKQFLLILLFYVGAIFGGTIVGTVILFTKEIADPRELSPFISHIRFSLNICLAIFILCYFIFKEKTFIEWHKILFGAVAIWLFAFLLIIGTGTGIVILMITSVILLLLIFIQSKKRSLLIFLVSSVLIFSTLSAIYINSLNKEFTNYQKIDIKKLEPKTASGNLYFHDTVNFMIEKGRYAGLYICEKELSETWNQRSSFDFYGQDKANQEIKHTIIRYLNSKNIRKDSEGVMALNKKDIANIENGITNIDYTKKFSAQSRISKFLMSYHIYKKTADPSRKSIIQRVEYWKASLGIIKENVLIGVGTGDINSEFAAYYEKNNSRLEKLWRLRSHNQFLAIAVAFGIIGLLWFLFALFYPPIKLKAFGNYYFLVFFIIALLSMLTEDTLETQPGVTFFAFFYSFFLFSMKKDRLCKRSLNKK